MQGQAWSTLHTRPQSEQRADARQRQRRLTVPVYLLRIRGELAIGAHLRATDLYTVGSFDPDHDAVMRIGVGLQPTGLTRGEAPGGGLCSRISAFLSTGICFEQVVGRGSIALCS